MIFLINQTKQIRIIDPPGPGYTDGAENVQQPLLRYVDGIESRLIQPHGCIAKPTQDASASVILGDINHTEISDTKIVDVAIDMVNLLNTLVPPTSPGEYHQVVSRALLATGTDMRVVLPLVMTGTVLHPLAVVVLWGRMHLYLTQPEASERVEPPLLGAIEPKTFDRLPEPGAIAEDEHHRVIGIDRKGQGFCRFVIG